MHKEIQSLFPETNTTDIRHVYSPYRVCPVGAHIDHQHGHVTGFALDHGVDFYYTPTETGVINLFSSDFEGQVIFPKDAMPAKYDHWGRYIQAAIHVLKKNYELHVGIQGLVSGSLPVGGLSSSSAVLLCYIMALADVNHISLDEHALIELAFQAEKEYIGLSLGKLDQSCEVLCKKDSSIHNWEAGCPEMIALYDAIKRAPGVYGGRFSGAGFKGCCIALADPAYRDLAIHAISERYLAASPEMEGKYEVRVCKTADGLRRVS